MVESLNSVSVIGCGWLGLPLAKRFLQQGLEVKGSTRSDSKLEMLKKQGIVPFLFELDSREKIDEKLLDADALVICVPPGRRNSEKLANYASGIDRLLKEAVSKRRVKKVVFVSSSSVYGNDWDELLEVVPAAPTTESGKVIREAEVRIMQSGIPYVILRFGGLAGPDRHPGNFLAGRKELPSGEQVVNFLHLHDAVRVIMYMVEHQVHNEIYNVASPIHPKKKIFYPQMANSIGADPPTFADDGSNFKRELSVNKLLVSTHFVFHHPDPMKYTYDK